MKKTKTKVEKAISTIEKTLNVKHKLAIGLAALLTLSVAISTILPTQNDVIKSSVMVTNISGTNGGSGVIVKSSSTRSEVLTNAHVCEVGLRGGMVTSKTAQYMISNMRVSYEHDLCLIEVHGNLGVQTDIASSAPRQYYEKAIVSGHPSLFPNVVTEGHFSGTEVLFVLNGFKECTGKETSESEKFYCEFVGAIPLIRRYETTLVTATIMPGSSGSGVYNSNKELTGLVFAGQGGLGYAWTVPYEYLRYFLEEEVQQIDRIYPKTAFTLTEAMEEQEHFDNLEDICAKRKYKRLEQNKKLLIENLCRTFKRRPYESRKNN